MNVGMFENQCSSETSADFQAAARIMNASTATDGNRRMKSGSISLSACR